MIDDEMTDERDPEEAIGHALRDWSNETAMIHGFGLPAPRPGIDKDTGLWWVTLGCVVDDLEYWREYNNMVETLVHLHGIPPWAPIRRVPDVYVLLEAFARTAEPMPEERTDGRRRDLSFVLEGWAVEPAALGVDDARGLWLVGGDVAVDRGRIDVVDLVSGRWMVKLDLERTVDGFPWDRFRSDAEREQLFSPAAIRRRERVGNACADCDRSGVDVHSLPHVGYVIDTESPEYQDFDQWQTCAGSTPQCGWLCPECSRKHAWESGITLEPNFERRPGGTATVRAEFLRGGHVCYVVSTAGHELVQFADAPDDEDRARVDAGRVELLLVPFEHTVGLFVRFEGERWEGALFNPSDIRPDLRASASDLLAHAERALVRFLLIDAATLEITAVREIALTDDVRRALIDAHEALERRPWPGGRAIQEERFAALRLVFEDAELRAAAIARMVDGPWRGSPRS